MESLATGMLVVKKTGSGSGHAGVKLLKELETKKRSKELMQSRWNMEWILISPSM